MCEAFATAVASNLASKLSQYLFAPIGRQFGYVLWYKSYVEDLKNGVEKLEIARERVQHSVDEAMYNGKPIENDIKNWLESVENKANQAQNLLKHGESAKHACFHGWLPNPIVRHPNGRKVKKMTQVIRVLHDESVDTNFQKVYYENLPIGMVITSTSAARFVDKKEDVLESRTLIIEDIVKALVDDTLCVIGVYGPGGVGKSKLLEDVERRVREEKLFDVVVTANISRDPDLRRIQEDIAYALGLKLMNEDTAPKRAELLRKRLENDPQKNILIILDSLWMKLELKEVGIPCGYDNKVRGCKLLLTSRYRHVLYMDMDSDREFHLDALEHREARRLFERMLGDRVNDPEFRPLVDRLVKTCGGLPLLIVSLAKRLKHGNLATWRNASTHIDGSGVKSIVELNYKDLKDERIKSLFMLCALGSGRISMRDLLVYCMGLGLYKNFSKAIDEARDRLIMDVRNLQDSSLLLDSDDMEKVIMHDIFVDMAISIASTEWKALVSREDYGFREWSKDELRKCTMMSFRYVGIDELPEKLDCPNLRMLLLIGKNQALKISESFFESMEKLLVLDLTHLSLTSLPSSMVLLENLKSLCLDQCHLEDVTVLGKLKGLQFLSLFKSAIGRLPKEIGELIELRFLDLRGCTGLKVIEPGVLGSLVNLEELYMEDSFDQWVVEDEAPQSNASLAELKNNKKLKTLYIAIPHSASLSRDLPFGKLNKYRIQIGNVQDWSSEDEESRTLKLKLDSDNLREELEGGMQRCLQRTQHLSLDGLQDGKDSINDLCVEGLQELKYLHVQNSPSFQYVVHSSENVPCTAFERLEWLFLKNLNNLKKICRGYLTPESFSKLKIVKVDNCGEIKYLFPLSMTRILMQLEEIEISKCHLMQQIVTDAKPDEDTDEIDVDSKVKSCNLRRLTLQNLPEMVSFSKTMDHSVIFFNGQQLIKLQSLEAITIERCQLIQEVFDLEGATTSKEVEILSGLRELILSDLPRLGHIWNKNPWKTLCFRNLRTLKVQNCENLSFLFSSFMAKALWQIKEIEIVRCRLLEEIIDSQEEELEEVAFNDLLEFPLLTSLSLEELSNLRTFSNGKYRIHCPTLRRLRISGCPKMMTFSSFEGKQQSITADIGLQQAVGGANSSLSLPVLFDQNVSFPSLKELTLVSLCGLMKIWHNELPKESFCKLTSITVRDCENLSHIFPSTLIEWFGNLKIIEVVKCTSLESLMEHVAINTKIKQKHMVFLDLKEVKLRDLPRLNAFMTSSTEATLNLPSLTKVSLHHCQSLSYLFTYDTSKTLDKLEKLEVSGCKSMQEVVDVEESEERKLKAVKFYHLHTLKLHSLKSLISFSLGSCAYEFPSLRNLSILECTNLKAFILRLPAPRVGTMNEGFASFDESPHSLFDGQVAFPKLEELCLTGIQSRELWENEMPDESICQLKVLEVKRCPNLLNVIPSFMWRRLLHCMESLTVEQCPCLKKVFTVSMAKSLVRLQYLGLGGCRDMEYIVAREEEKSEDATDIIVMPQLVTLYLHKMIKLQSFCHGKHILEWPSLKKFTVEDCKAVEVILGDVSCGRSKGSIPKYQPLLLVEKVEFPNMELMKISHMDNMEKIWLGELASKAFTKLETLVVEYCEKLSSVFSSHTILTRFQNVKKITVTDCESLEVVFCIQEFNFNKACSTSTFELRELVLMRLPKMKNVWSELPQDGLTFGRLRRMEVVECERLGSLFPSSVAKSMTCLEKLCIRDCGVEEIITEHDRVGMSADDLFFSQLTALRLLELSKLRSFYKSSHTSTWPLLKELQVRHCGKARSFSFACEFQSCQGTTTNENQPALFSFEKVIPSLKGLTLMREDVAMLQQRHYIFGNLRELDLGCYHDENVAFPSDFFLHRFPILEHLVVSCSSFEEIFLEDAFRDGGATPYGELTSMERPLEVLRNLKRLELNKLCKLQRLWKDGSLMAEILKQIETLLISECSSLLIVFPSPTAFQRLTQLEVKGCTGLVYMGTCSTVPSLLHLTRLILRDCGKMVNVVTNDENGVEEISFPELEELILDGLPSLESFSPVNCTFRFPSLEWITVKQCPKMNIFCNGALSTPILDEVLLSDEDYEGCWEGDLNTTIQSLST